jgi:hypothetical protein
MVLTALEDLTVRLLAGVTETELIKNYEDKVYPQRNMDVPIIN